MKPGTIVLVLVFFVSGVGKVAAEDTDRSPVITYEDFDVSGDTTATVKTPDWLVWTLSGLGVAGVGIGMALYSVGQSDEDMLVEIGRDEDGRARSITQRNAAMIEDDASERMNLGMGFMIGGAVLGGGAALWYLYGQKDAEITNAPTENRIVPFGAMPRFELNLARRGLQLFSGFTF